jgi:hypothetical protein
LVVEFEHFWCLFGSNFLAIQQKAETASLNSLALRVCVKDFLHSRGFLDLEKGLLSRLQRAAAATTAQRNA